MKTFKLIYKVCVGVAVMYTTHKMLDEKTDELLDKGGLLNAFTIGAGQMGLSIAAGVVTAETITKHM